MATDVTSRIRAKIEAGVLALPGPPPQRVTVGKGSGRICDGCDEPITDSQVEYETAPPVMRFHHPCLAEWHGASGERNAQSA